MCDGELWTVGGDINQGTRPGCGIENLVSGEMPFSYRTRIIIVVYQSAVLSSNQDCYIARYSGTAHVGHKFEVVIAVCLHFTSKGSRHYVRLSKLAIALTI